MAGVTGSATVEVPLPATLAASTLPGTVGDTTTQSTLAVAAVRMNALFASTSATADVFSALSSATGVPVPPAPIPVQISPAFVASTPGLAAALAAAMVPPASATTSDSSSNVALSALVVIPAALFGLLAWYCCRRQPEAPITGKVPGVWARSDQVVAEATNIGHANPMTLTVHVQPPLILGNRGGTRV